LLSLFWFGVWGATLVAGNAQAAVNQWAMANGLAFLAGGAFGAAVVRRPK